MIGREVLPARLRPGWRMAIALPILVASSIGAVELGHAALVAVRPMARALAAEVLQAELDAVAAWPDDGGRAANRGCGNGGAIIGAVAFGAWIVLLGVLIGASIARGRGCCPGHSGPEDDDDDDGGDGGDEDEIELPLDAERVLVIAVPRRDSPGAPGPGNTETN